MGTTSLRYVVSLLLFLTPGYAQDVVIQSSSPRPHLVELFTSEGCSSCPPAEAWLSRLKDEPQLWQSFVPIEFHVDYWDNLGWPDRFARAQYTERQRHYVAQWGGDSVYTPCFVLDGREWRDWEGGMGKMPVDKSAGQLTLTVHEGKVIAQYRGESGIEATLHLAWLGFNLSSQVQRGENGGRTLVHDFIALDLQQTALLVSAPGTYASPELAPNLQGTDRPGAVAAWVTTPGGSLLQVAGGWLPLP